MKTWKIRSSNHASAQKLADALSIPVPLARILVSRGYGTAEQASAFLYASLEDLSRPFMLPNMGAAVEIIGEAMQAGKKIAIYGDYDVDGICASTLMREAFSWFGVEARVYIPSRFREGYGMNEAALETLRSEGVEVVITVDNGIASAALIESFMAKGLQFVVTDHHQLPEILPPCVVVNPLLAPSVTAAYRSLCGCGTAYMLAMGMLIRLAPQLYDEAHRRKLLDLVALATVADMVPLLEDNRILVREGLALINNSPRRGMAALVQLVCGDKAVRTSDIAFRLAPCINACGRLDETASALALFHHAPAEDVTVLAEQVRDFNDTRKDIERSITEEAIAQFDEFSGRMHCAVAVGENWHPGVIGIVASRLVETFHCPAVVLTTTKEKPDIYTGSARSVKGFHLYEGLQAVGETLLQFGGHEMAAGLSVEKARLEEFRAAFSAVASAHEDEISDQVLWIDDVLKLDDANDTLEQALRLMEPCGSENPEPLFALEHQWHFGHRAVGADGDHLRLEFPAPDGTTVPGIAFRKGNYPFDDKHRYDFAFHLGENCFRGVCTTQLQVTDIAPSWQAAEDRVRHAFMAHGENYLGAEAQGLANQRYFHTKVRGVSFEGRQPLIEKLAAGDRLVLAREQNNPADANAVAVLCGTGEKIGYLSRAVSAQLAPLMDLGSGYEAKVLQVTGEAGQTRGVNIEVWRADASQAQAADAVAGDLRGLPEEALMDLLLDAFLDDGALLPIQQAALDNIVQRREDTAVIMPTGRGKSLIYQLAAGILACRDNLMTVVLMPLKALIGDQYLSLVDRLAPLGYRIYKANGDLSAEERVAFFAAVEEKRADILFLTPEFFVRQQKLFRAHAADIGQIVIDEAHYLVTKRAAYKALPSLKAHYPKAVWTYLTATVPPVEMAAFGEIISGAGLYIDDHIRYNLHIIDARHSDKKLVYLYRLFMHPEKTIVYVNSRRQAFTLSQRLREILPYQLRPLVGYYHGGLPREARRVMEKAFKEGEIRLLFATTAFGEGMHIADIRNVVLYHPCFSVEAFNQLSGRCARDGEDGQVHLLYGERDFSLNEMIVSQRGPSRETLGRMYQRLKAHAFATGGVIKDGEASVMDQLARLDSEVSAGQWRLALRIFEELEFLHREETGDGTCFVVEKAPQRRQLSESDTFNEGQSEARALAQFQEIAFSKDLGALEKIIQRALYPENWQGREVKP